MEKMNIIDILRDCPEGTKLYSLVHGEVELIRVGVEDIYCKPDYLNHELSFNSDGRWVENQGECILFPSKENRNWNTFKRPFKDGDIIYHQGVKATAIFYKQTNDHTISHCFLNILGELKIYHYHCKSLLDWRFASEEEKQELFKVIKDNGYKWNPETKTLDKLIVPKFKVGDRVKKNKDYISGIVTDIFDDSFKVTYNSGGCSFVQFHYQCDWELVPNKFDITTMKPFDKVLVRCNSLEKWHIQFFEKYNIESDAKYPFICLCNSKYCQCIPYEGNEHLCDTTNECDEYFKNW